MNTMLSVIPSPKQTQLAKRCGLRFAVTACLLGAANMCLAQVPASPEAQTAGAASAPGGAPDQQIGKGEATRAWLGAQASRKQASQTRQSLSGPVMSTVHERYVKSFSQPVEATPIRADMVNTNR
jgi:Protein of unknown function (DUF3613)